MHVFNTEEVEDNSVSLSHGSLTAYKLGRQDVDCSYLLLTYVHLLQLSVHSVLSSVSSVPSLLSPSLPPFLPSSLPPCVLGSVLGLLKFVASLLPTLLSFSPSLLLPYSSLSPAIVLGLVDSLLIASVLGLVDSVDCQCVRLG